MISKNSLCMMIFGSAARGDIDRHSDRDLLLVASGHKDLQTAAAVYSALGWSCSLYSWRTIEHLCSRGGYFIEHLRREGRVLRDLDDSLAHRIAVARSKTCYRSEIEQARKLAGVIEFIPNTSWGVAWALDILSVAVRSFGYAMLADKGIFVFNYKKMLNRLVSIGIFSKRSSLQLETLRLWKIRYRAGNYCASWDKAIPLIREADKLMKLGMHVRRLNPHQYVERSARGYCEQYGWYANTRSLEAVDKCIPGVLNHNIVSSLHSPQEYSALLSKLSFETWMQQALEASCQRMALPQA